MNKFFLLAILVLLAIGVPAQSETASGSLKDSERARMEKQIHELEARVRNLERRLPESEAKHPPAIWIPSPESRRDNRTPLDLPKGCVPPPKNWGERQINGMTFYIVPCSSR
jgi:hypothetical protein